MDAPTDAASPRPEPVACPYCARPMRWCGDGRRTGSGCFECESCGTFDVPGFPADARLKTEQRRGEMGVASQGDHTKRLTRRFPRRRVV
jgi:hypothetical protein